MVVCVSAYHHVNPTTPWPIEADPSAVSWRLFFPIPHDFILLICWAEGTETTERCVTERACVRDADQTSRSVGGAPVAPGGRRSHTGLIIRCLDLNPTLYVIHIAQYRDIE